MNVDDLELPDPDDWPERWTRRGWTAESIAAARAERFAPDEPEPEPDLSAVANAIAQLARATKGNAP